MKRLSMMACLVAALVLSLTGCKKAAVSADLPSLKWESNPGFAQKELTASLDAVVTVSAPAGIDALTLTLGMGDYAVLANPYIKLAANKGNASKNPVFDMVDDSAVADFLSGLGMTAGSVLRGYEQVKIDLAAILEALTAGQLVDNNTSFYIIVKLADTTGHQVEATARFHYTVAPEYRWTNNPSFATIDLNAAQVATKVSVWAPGRIEKLTIKLEEEGPSAQLVNYIRNRTTGQQTLIDLVNDEMVADTFKGYFPAGAAVKGRTEAVLDFSFMYGIKYDLSAGTNIFVITTEDQFGKQTSTQVKFKK